MLPIRVAMFVDYKKKMAITLYTVPKLENTLSCMKCSSVSKGIKFVRNGQGRVRKNGDISNPISFERYQTSTPEPISISFISKFSMHYGCWCLELGFWDNAFGLQRGISYKKQYKFRKSPRFLAQIGKGFGHVLENPSINSCFCSLGSIQWQQRQR